MNPQTGEEYTDEELRHIYSDELLENNFRNGVDSFKDTELQRSDVAYYMRNIFDMENCSPKREVLFLYSRFLIPYLKESIPYTKEEYRIFYLK